jgi:hypothetical protein
MPSSRYLRPTLPGPCTTPPDPASSGLAGGGTTGGVAVGSGSTGVPIVDGGGGGGGVGGTASGGLVAGGVAGAFVLSGGVISPPQVRMGWAPATEDTVIAATNAADTRLLP